MRIELLVIDVDSMIFERAKNDNQTKSQYNLLNEYFFIRYYISWLQKMQI